MHETTNRVPELFTLYFRMRAANAELRRFYLPVEITSRDGLSERFIRSFGHVLILPTAEPHPRRHRWQNPFASGRQAMPLRPRKRHIPGWCRQGRPAAPTCLRPRPCSGRTPHLAWSQVQHASREARLLSPAVGQLLAVFVFLGRGTLHHVLAGVPGMVPGNSAVSPPIMPVTSRWA